MTDQVAPSPQSLCDHPVYVHHMRGGEPLTIPLCQLCGEIGWDDLREQMAEHRRMVLGEAADYLAACQQCEKIHQPREDPDGRYAPSWASPDDGHAYRPRDERSAEAIRRLAAAAPPAGLSARAGRFEELLAAEHEQFDQRGELLRSVVEYQNAPSATASAPVPAETAPAVPEEADGQRVGEGVDPPRDDLDDPGIRAAIAEAAISCIGGDNIAWAEIRESVADVQPLIAELRKTRADRDRLAAQVAQFQRVVEAAQAWRAMRSGTPTQPKPESFALIAAVDALPDAGPHQHECACNRNWGGPCGPCVCEDPPRQGVWRLVCGAENIPPNQTYATKGAAEDVTRLHGGACPGAHGVEFVPDAGTDQTEGDHG